MDEIDISLVLMLLGNSRTPYRELAERLSLSVNAVHRRIQELISSGVIKAFTAKINLAALGGASIMVTGICSSSNISDVCDLIGGHSNTYWISLAGGNRFYVGAYLPNVNNLDEFLGFIDRNGVDDLDFGIEPISQFTGNLKISDLDQLDYQIIGLLHNDARRQVSIIADEIGVSARTIRRRLNAMTESGLIDFSLEWYPSASKDIISFLDLTMEDGVEKEQRKWKMFMDHSPHFLYPFSFINSKNRILGLVWTDTMNTLQELSNKLRDENDVQSVTPDILYDGFIYDTWRDHFLDAKISPA